jgi:hypothetical protein
MEMTKWKCAACDFRVELKAGEVPPLAEPHPKDGHTAYWFEPSREFCAAEEFRRES